MSILGVFFLLIELNQTQAILRVKQKTMPQPTFLPILPEKKKPKLTNAPTVVIDTQYNWNRASGPVQIQAQNDVEAVMTWLSEHKSTHTTYQSYKKEAERFLLWASLKAQKKLASVTREDILRFEDFLANPDPDWCGPTRPRHHPDWRPFAYWAKPNQTPKLGLSPKSIGRQPKLASYQVRNHETVFAY